MSLVGNQFVNARKRLRDKLIARPMNRVEVLGIGRVVRQQLTRDKEADVKYCQSKVLRRCSPIQVASSAKPREVFPFLEISSSSPF